MIPPCPGAVVDPLNVVASVLLLASVVLLFVGLKGPILGWIGRREDRARAFGQRLGTAKSAALTVYGAPLVALITFLCFLALGAWPIGVILGFVMYRVADAVPELSVHQQHRKLGTQLVDGFVGIANSLKSGLSLPRAVAQVAQDSPPPLSVEFERILQDYERGKTIEQAMFDARPRIDSRNFDLAVQAFRVGMQRGGNLAEVFDKIANSIREIWRLEEYIRTKTTEGRSTARFMTMMPAVFLGLLFVMDAEGASLLFTDPIGITVLGIAFLLNLAANMWIRRILDVDV